MKKTRKQNKYAHLTGPQATLDFHLEGPMLESQIITKAEHFIRDSADARHDFIAIIVGKGIHSQNGPVIGPLLRAYLPRHPLVKTYNDAPPHRGGSGALEIHLN